MAWMRILFGAAGVVLAYLIAIAIIRGDFSAAGSWLTNDPWGIVTLVDLYLGFAIIALVIWSFEKPASALFWTIPLPFLGNVWTVVWLIWRLPDLLGRLRGR